MRKVRIEAPRGDIVDRNGVKLVHDQGARRSSRSCPRRCPSSVREDADDYRKALAAAEHDAADARRTAYDAFERQLRDDGRKSTKAEKQRAQPAARRRRATARTVAVPPCRPTEPELIDALPAHRPRCIGSRRETIHAARDPRDRRRAVLQRHDPHRRPARRSSTTCASTPSYFPGVVVEKRYLRDYPHGELAAQLFGTVSEISRDAAQGEAQYKGVAPGHADRPERARGDATTSTCAARTATRGSSSTRSAAATTSARRR